MLGLNSWILLEGEFYGYMIRGGLVGVLVCFSILVFFPFFFNKLLVLLDIHREGKDNHKNLTSAKFSNRNKFGFRIFPKMLTFLMRR